VETFLSSLAYIDPGIGALLIQLFIGGVVGVLYALKRWRVKLKSVWHGLWSRFSRPKNGPSP
jgi:hypothetical protein